MYYNTHAVKKNILATEAAFSNATLATFAGSTMPSSIRLENVLVLALYPNPDSIAFSTINLPHCPAFSAICSAGF